MANSWILLLSLLNAAGRETAKAQDPVTAAAESPSSDFAVLCSAAFEKNEDGTGRLTPPLAVQLRSGNGGWAPRTFTKLEGLIGEDAVARTLACISESTVDSGSKYTDGAAAYDMVWQLRLLALPDGRLITSNSFRNPPPQEKTGYGPGFGAPPVDDFVNWAKPALEGTTLFAGIGDVKSALPLPDGRRLAIGGSSSTTVVLDVDSGAALARFETGIYMTHLATSPAGRYLAAASEYDVSLWDLETGRPVREIEGRAPVALSVDGAHLFYARADDDGLEIRRLEIASGKEKRFTRVKGTTRAILAALPNGSGFVLGTNDGLEVLDAQNGKRVRSLSREPSFVGSLSADGSRFAIFSNGHLSVLEVSSGRQVARFPVEGVGVEQIAISSDGRRVGLAKSFSGFEVFEVDEGRSVVKVDETATGCYAVGVASGEALFFTGWTDGSLKSIAVPATEE